MVSGECGKRQSFTVFWSALVLSKVEGHERRSAWGLCSYVTWHFVVWWTGATVSDEHAASIFTVVLAV
jgi:hypothetical protein